MVISENIVQEFYNFYEEQQKDLLEKIKTKIFSEDSLYKEMGKIVEEKADAFQSDFYIHDYPVLLEYKKDFLWIVRKTGTHLLLLEDERIENGKWLVSEYYEVIRKLHNITGIYYYNTAKNKLMKVSPKKADQIIKQHEKKLLN